MANLKDLKIRISSVKSTQKITKAMKMVAASKLRRAQERAEAARPYSQKMERMIITLARAVGEDKANAPRLLAGTGRDDQHLFVLMTSDRGLCGGFNSNLVRAVKLKARALHEQGKQVTFLIVGKKGHDQLKMVYKENIVDTVRDLSKKKVEYADAESVAEKILEMFAAGKCDVCHLVYNKFISAISQKATFQQLIPLEIKVQAGAPEEAQGQAADAVYEYEPGEESVLTRLLPMNLAVQIFHGMLESAASEQGARMSAMDNATRNAGEMIAGLTLQYNRTRQAAITTELTEIISGAEAL